MEKNLKILPELTDEMLCPIYNLEIRRPTTFKPAYFFLKDCGYVIDWDVPLSNGINLQRPFVWNTCQKENLIISMLFDDVAPIPNFHAAFYETEYSTVVKIIDGKQRLNAIKEFIEGKFPLNIKGYKYFYEDLPSIRKYKINCYSLNFCIRYEYFDDRLSDEQLVTWFKYVNFGGTQQENRHMNKLIESLNDKI